MLTFFVDDFNEIYFKLIYFFEIKIKITVFLRKKLQSQKILRSNVIFSHPSIFLRYSLPLFLEYHYLPSLMWEETWSASSHLDISQTAAIVNSAWDGKFQICHFPLFSLVCDSKNCSFVVLVLKSKAKEKKVSLILKCFKVEKVFQAKFFSKKGEKIVLFKKDKNQWITSIIIANKRRKKSEFLHQNKIIPFFSSFSAHFSITASWAADNSFIRDENRLGDRFLCLPKQENEFFSFSFRRLMPRLLFLLFVPSLSLPRAFLYDFMHFTRHK